MASLALLDDLSGLTAGALAGQTTKSGHTWANTGGLTSGAAGAPLSVDSIPSLTNLAPGGETSGGALTSFAPGSAAYGAGVRGVHKSIAANYFYGVILRYTQSGGNSTYYEGQAVSSANIYSLNKVVAGISTPLVNVAHTFGVNEQHFIYLNAQPDGAGGVNLTFSVDNASTLTYHDLSTNSPITATGEPAFLINPNGGTTTTEAHILDVQTDPQVCAATGPSSGAMNATSTTFTATLEVPATLTTTATLSDGGHGGTFAPASLSWTGGTGAGLGATVATFTYTPATAFTGVTSISASVTTPVSTFSSNAITYTVIAPVTYTLTGPSGGQSGHASANFTAAPSGTIPSDTITPSDGGAGGTFTPSSLVFTASSAPQTFTYTPASPGTKTLTLTSAGSYTVTGSPATYISSLSVGYTLMGPPTGFVGSASTNFTLTPAGNIASDTVSFSDGGAGGTFTPPSPLTFTATSAPQTFTYTPLAAGNKTITLTSADSGTITGSPAAFLAFVAATGYAWSGSSSAIAGVTSGAITLTPNGLVSSTDTLTLSDGGHGGVFTPATLTFANTALGKSFVYENASVGSVTIAATGLLGLSFTPSTWSFTALANTTIVFQSFVSGLPAGFASTAVVTPKVWTGTALAAPGTAVAGTVVETSVPGSYWCQVSYHTTDIAWPAVPSVLWAVGGATAVDPSPKGRTILDPGGLDAIPAEGGVNFTQLVSAIGAACTGIITINLDGSITYSAAGNPGTPRITAQPNRTAVTLSLPGN